MADQPMDNPSFSCSASFPPSFMFGFATSSVQIEGATMEGGRGEGIWDKFARIPGKIADGSTPDIACDHYHMFQEDILEMKRLGVTGYRFSISWPRLFPVSLDHINKEGIAFYNSLIDCVIRAGLTPFVTLYHWDLPQFLEDDIDVKGWRTKNIIDHFVTFAKTCFHYFGDRVKHWITFNEIHLNAFLAYNSGLMAPGRCENPNADPYIVAHHQLLSHAAVVKMYRAHYQKEQEGIIGITINLTWYEPFSDSQEDKDASRRLLDFEMRWILDPLHFGEYPLIMRKLVGDRLPRFSTEESQDLKNSTDFTGVNYYTAMWASSAKHSTDGVEVQLGFPDCWTPDSQAQFHWRNKDGNVLGEQKGPPGNLTFRSCPWGLRKVLACIDEAYGKIPIYITENGTVDSNTSLDLSEPLNDQHRIKFLREHFQQASASIWKDEVNVKGYFLWTFMDDWEWSSGYTLRFGLYHVDFNDPGCPRFPKASAKWLSNFLRT